jgi:hypothetical protein
VASSILIRKQVSNNVIFFIINSTFEIKHTKFYLPVVAGYSKKDARFRAAERARKNGLALAKRPDAPLFRMP